jgi:hypothetical protein
MSEAVNHPKHYGGNITYGRLAKLQNCVGFVRWNFAIFDNVRLSAVLFSHLNNYQNENIKINIKQKMV